MVVYKKQIRQLQAMQIHGPDEMKTFCIHDKELSNSRDWIQPKINKTIDRDGK